MIRKIKPKQKKSKSSTKFSTKVFRRKIFEWIWHLRFSDELVELRKLNKITLQR